MDHQGNSNIAREDDGIPVCQSSGSIRTTSREDVFDKEVILLNNTLGIVRKLFCFIFSGILKTGRRDR